MKLSSRRFALVLCLFGLALSIGERAEAEYSALGKRVIAIEPLPVVTVELPDGMLRDVGPEITTRITTELSRSGKFIVVDPLPKISSDSQVRGETSALRSQKNVPGWEWSGRWVPSATLRFQVRAISFVSGSHGNRMFYGFNERMPHVKGERFFPSSFDRRSMRLGDEWTGSRAGLDLGEGFVFDIGIAHLGAEYASYSARIALQMEVDSPIAGTREYQMIDSTTNGFFLDVVGGYLSYEVGLVIARTDAMLRSHQEAIGHAVVKLKDLIKSLPLTGKVDALVPALGESGETDILIGTGPNAGVPIGTRYEVMDQLPRVVVEVKAVSSSGVIARVIQGRVSQVQVDQIVRELPPESAQLKVASVSSALTASSVVVSNKGGSFKNPLVDALLSPLKKLVSIVLLPYRIWRFYQYDRSYQYKTAQANGTLSLKKTLDWAATARKSAWAKSIGLSEAEVLPRLGSTVAVIDSGVDYNHPSLRATLAPARGWDFISGDARAFDDSYFGTELASLAVAVNPTAYILPIKIFNPWGVTQASAIESAFRYAVDQGAQVILCGWSTGQVSEALKRGIAYAESKDVLVVTSAGEGGRDLRDFKRYPAAWSREFRNLVVVAALDQSGNLLQASGKKSNFSAEFVQIAAPAVRLKVARPREKTATSTQVAYAAALVAGQASRYPVGWSAEARKSALLESARSQANLNGRVEGARVLQISSE